MKMVFGIVIIVAAVVLIASLAPPYFSNYQFEDTLRTEVADDYLHHQDRGRYPR